MTKAKDTPENLEFGNTFRLLAVDPSGNVVRLPTDDMLRSGIGGIIETDDNTSSGMISIGGPTTINIKGGKAVIYKRDTYLSSGTGVITKKIISWSATSLTNPGLGSATPVIVDEDGVVQYGTNPFTNISREKYKDHVQLGTAGEADDGTLVLVDDAIGVSALNNDISMYAISEFLGLINSPENPFNIIPSTLGTSLQLEQTAGEAYIRQAGLGIDFLIPNVYSRPSVDPMGFVLHHLRDESFSISATAEVDPTQFESSLGVLSPMTANKFSIQYMWHAPKAQLVQIVYGDQEYTSMSTAEDDIPNLDLFRIEGSQDTVFQGYIILKGDATDLTDPAQAKFIAPTFKVFI